MINVFTEEWDAEKAKRIAAEEAREESKFESIKNLMDSCKWIIEQAMEALKIPKNDYSKYIAMM